MRADDRSNHVVRAFRIGNPCAHCFVDRILERAASALDWNKLRAEQFHSQHVRMLSFDVFGAHEDTALEAEQSAGGRDRNAVLPRPSLGDDSLLAEPLR